MYAKKQDKDYSEPDTSSACKSVMDNWATETYTINWKLKTNCMKFKYLILALMLCGCGNTSSDRQQYVPLLIFNLDTTAINDNDEIKILYCSSGGNSNPCLLYTSRCV